MIQVRDEDNGEEARTCPLEQAIPEMLEPALAKTALKPILLRPQLWFPPSWKGPRLTAALRPVAERLGLDPGRVPNAVAAAARAQREFELACRSIGERALEFGRSRQSPMVLVCGPQHVIHEPLINSGIPELFRENGRARPAHGLSADRRRRPENGPDLLELRQPHSARRPPGPVSTATYSR